MTLRTAAACTIAVTITIPLAATAAALHWWDTARRWLNDDRPLTHAERDAVAAYIARHNRQRGHVA